MRMYLLNMLISVVVFRKVFGVRSLLIENVEYEEVPVTIARKHALRQINNSPYEVGLVTKVKKKNPFKNFFLRNVSANENAMFTVAIEVSGDPREFDLEKRILKISKDLPYIRKSYGIERANNFPGYTYHNYSHYRAIVVEVLAFNLQHVLDALETAELPPTRVELLAILYEVGLGIQELHKAGIVHGNINPSNIGFVLQGPVPEEVTSNNVVSLISQIVEAKIFDFRSAKLLSKVAREEVVCTKNGDWLHYSRIVVALLSKGKQFYKVNYPGLSQKVPIGWENDPFLQMFRKETSEENEVGYGKGESEHATGKVIELSAEEPFFQVEVMELISYLCTSVNFSKRPYVWRDEVDFEKIKNFKIFEGIDYKPKGQSKEVENNS